MNNNQQVEFTTPSAANIDISTYLENIKQLIKKERETDQTVVLHSDEEIRNKYFSSIVAVFDNKIIWNSSIYPTHMKPLDNLILDWKKIRVWESWSVIIHPDFRWHWLWRKLTTASFETFFDKYDIIVGATVNNIMFTLRTHQWFENIPFPKELYEEWKKYLAPFMGGWDLEFQERAKCMMYNLNLTEQQKTELINILQKEYVINLI